MNTNNASQINNAASMLLNLLQGTPSASAPNVLAEIASLLIENQTPGQPNTLTAQLQQYQQQLNQQQQKDREQEKLKQHQLQQEQLKQKQLKQQQVSACWLSSSV